MRYLVQRAATLCRSEYFGATAWQRGRREFWLLEGPSADLVLLADRPRTIGDEVRWAPGVRELIDLGLVGVTDGGTGWAADFETVASLAAAGARLRVTGEQAKPFWAHLQPFTRCNQRCDHCYCDGAATADGWLRPLDWWLALVDRLFAWGVREVYVTGGESLMYRQTLDLVDHIRSLGLGTGLSTNGARLTEPTLARLRELGIRAIQVSFDAADPDLAARIRGHRHAHRDALAAIRSLGQFMQVTVNTVVSAHNCDQLAQIIEACKPEGVTHFKFFPQKQAGRATTNGAALSAAQIRTGLPALCSDLARRYGVEVETLDPAQPCGSASSGFAIDQHGHLYPCIFGVAVA